jgi:hypothetical protein
MRAAVMGWVLLWRAAQAPPLAAASACAGRDVALEEALARAKAAEDALARWGGGVGAGGWGLGAGGWGLGRSFQWGAAAPASSPQGST